MTTSLRFAVLGPGGVGGFLAAALERSGETVEVVAREGTAELIGRDGIDVRSVTLGTFVTRVPATSRLTDEVDVLFVATKATGLASALERIGATPGLVVPLLNGLDHVHLLRERFGAGRVPAAVIRIESDRPGPGRIVQTSPAVRVDMAAEDPGTAARLPAVAKALIRAGIPARIGASEAEVMWSKLVRLNSLACTTAASGQPIGYVRSDPEWRARLVACVQETAGAARAEGAPIDPAATLAELDAAHSSLGSSMQRDLAAGRTPELDAIPGSVMRAAARHGLACPTVRQLTQQIAWAAGVPAPAVD